MSAVDPVRRGILRAHAHRMRGRGLTHREIGKRLGISEATVKRYLSRVTAPTPLVAQRTPSADWRTAAACRDSDPELFFSEDEATTPDYRRVAQARRVCRSCPVMEQCAQWAIKHRIRHGIWGGLTRSQRRDAVTAANEQQRKAAA